MTLNFDELQEIDSPDDLLTYVHEKFDFNDMATLGHQNLRILTFYEAFLTGVEACERVLAGGNQKQIFREYLENVKKVDGDI